MNKNERDDEAVDVLYNPALEFNKDYYSNKLYDIHFRLYREKITTIIIIFLIFSIVLYFIGSRIHTTKK